MLSLASIARIVAEVTLLFARVVNVNSPCPMPIPFSTT
jgi:hypothetical protein